MSHLLKKDKSKILTKQPITSWPFQASKVLKDYKVKSLTCRSIEFHRGSSVKECLNPLSFNQKQVYSTLVNYHSPEPSRQQKLQSNFKKNTTTTPQPTKKLNRNKSLQNLMIPNQQPSYDIGDHQSYWCMFNHAVDRQSKLLKQETQFNMKIAYQTQMAEKLRQQTIDFHRKRLEQKEVKLQIKEFQLSQLKIKAQHKQRQRDYSAALQMMIEEKRRYFKS